MSALYLLALFNEISTGRSQDKLSNQDIYAWTQMHGVCLTPLELRVIRELDKVFTAVLSKDD